MDTKHPDDPVPPADDNQQPGGDAELFPWSPWTQGAASTLGCAVDADGGEEESESAANHLLALYLGFCS